MGVGWGGIGIGLGRRWGGVALGMGKGIPWNGGGACVGSGGGVMYGGDIMVDIMRSSIVSL